MRTIEALFADLRYGMRLLRRQPGFAATATLTMALGIGATTTLFSVVYGVLMKPLPWPDADRIMRVVETRAGHQGRLPGTIGNGAYFAWRERPATIEAIGGYGIGVTAKTALRSGGADPIRLNVVAMTRSTFDVLRARPMRGRFFTEDEVPAAGTAGLETPRPMLISHALWQDWFGGRDTALGTVIRLDDVPHTIIGVMPASFRFPDRDTRAWVPMPIPRVEANGWPSNARSIMIFGGLVRLKPGVSPQQAAAEGTARARQAPDPGMAAVAMFGSDAPSTLSVTPLSQSMTADVRPALLLLFAAVGLLLATAVANVSGLQLARASTRRREMAVRAALGAGRATLVRQLLAETALLAVVGAMGGVAMAFALSRALPSVMPADFPRTGDVAVNLPVLAFATVLSIAATIGACLMPATFARRLDVTSALADDTAASTAGGWRSPAGRLRGMVMAVQVAVACVLLVTAALLTRSFFALTHADRGYDPTNLLTARLDLPQQTDDQTRVRIADAVIDRMRAIPGVMHAGAGNALPFMSLGPGLASQLPSPDDPAIQVQVHATVRTVSPDYFAALRLPLLQGRLLTDADGTASPAIVVSRSFVQQYLGADPIGKHVPIGFTKDERTDWQVVGVVGDIRQQSVIEPQAPAVFVSYRQIHSAWLRSSIFFVIRTTGAPSSAIGSLRTAVREQDPTVALDSILTMEERVATSLAKPRLYALLLGGFGVAALVIAAVGLFGVLSYSVAQRSREIGLRTALGAQVHDIVGLVLGQALGIVASGVVLGLGAALAGSRVISAFLYGVGSHDILTLTGAPIVVMVVALVASFVPARRAARIDPLIAIRA
jgi:putative ABC transport system permease protein